MHIAQYNYPICGRKAKIETEKPQKKVSNSKKVTNSAKDKSENNNGKHTEEPLTVEGEPLNYAKEMKDAIVKQNRL